VISHAWAFVLDGHVFYVLSDVSGRTLVCDITTGQWHHWFTGALPGLWNMQRGLMWRGRALAAGAAGAEVWEVDPLSTLDEETEVIHRAVTGFMPIRGRAGFRQGALRLFASVGAPDDVGVEVRLRFSDDEGVTWSRTFTTELRVGAFMQTLSFRGLGRMRAPGRIWDIADAGGLVRIDGVESDMEGPA
jgi:hypothetical protein